MKLSILWCVDGCVKNRSLKLWKSFVRFSRLPLAGKAANRCGMHWISVLCVSDCGNLRGLFVLGACQLDNLAFWFCLLCSVLHSVFVCYFILLVGWYWLKYIWVFFIRLILLFSRFCCCMWNCRCFMKLIINSDIEFSIYRCYQPPAKLTKKEAHEKIKSF